MKTDDLRARVAELAAHVDESRAEFAKMAAESSDPVRATSADCVSRVMAVMHKRIALILSAYDAATPTKEPR